MTLISGGISKNWLDFSKGHLSTTAKNEISDESPIQLSKVFLTHEDENPGVPSHFFCRRDVKFPANDIQINKAKVTGG